MIKLDPNKININIKKVTTYFEYDSCEHIAVVASYEDINTSTTKGHKYDKNELILIALEKLHKAVELNNIYKMIPKENVMYEEEIIND